MKRRESIESWIGLVIMVLVADVLIFPLNHKTAHAAVNCATVTAETGADSDGDGLTDYEECNGIALSDHTTVFKGYLNKGTSTRDQYLDPNTKDLFVVLTKAGTTNLVTSRVGNNDANWFEFVSVPTASGGLGIAVHLISRNQADANRIVSPKLGQKAVTLTEDITPGTTCLANNPPGCVCPPIGQHQTACKDTTKDFGNMQEGTTMGGLDDGTIFTQRIVNYFISVCGSNWSTNPNCKDSTGQYSGQALADRFFKHTIAHEIGHALKLAYGTTASSYGGWHYRPGSQPSEMDQSVVVSGTTFGIGTTFKSGDQTGAQMK